MATPDIASRGDIVVQVEYDPVGAPGVYTNWCGARNFDLNVVNEFTSNKVGDCDDWSLPSVTLKAPAGQDITATMDATWHKTTHIQTSDWVLAQKLLKVRVEFVGAATGEVANYEGSAYIADMNLAGIGDLDGNAVSETVNLTYDGTITRNLAP